MKFFGSLNQEDIIHRKKIVKSQAQAKKFGISQKNLALVKNQSKLRHSAKISQKLGISLKLVKNQAFEKGIIFSNLPFISTIEKHQNGKGFSLVGLSFKISNIVPNLAKTRFFQSFKKNGLYQSSEPKSKPDACEKRTRFEKLKNIVGQLWQGVQA